VTTEEVLEWKTRENTKSAKERLWTKVDPNGKNPGDTYMSHIIKEVLKTTECTADNCAFVTAIVDLMFDHNVQTTTLSGKAIVKRMSVKAKEREGALQERLGIEVFGISFESYLFCIEEVLITLYNRKKKNLTN
jgi:hypothetical protein